MSGGLILAFLNGVRVGFFLSLLLSFSVASMAADKGKGASVPVSKNCALMLTRALGGKEKAQFLQVVIASQEKLVSLEAEYNSHMEQRGSLIEARNQALGALKETGIDVERVRSMDRPILSDQDKAALLAFYQIELELSEHELKELKLEVEHAKEREGFNTSALDEFRAVHDEEQIPSFETELEDARSRLEKFRALEESTQMSRDELLEEIRRLNDLNEEF